MTAALLVALATLGQVGGQLRYEPGRLYRSADGNYIIADATGKPWSSPDPEWLRRYVGSVNTAGQMPPRPAESATNYGIDMMSMKATAPESMRTNDANFGSSFYDSKFGGQVPLPEGESSQLKDWVPLIVLGIVVLIILSPRKAPVA